MQAVDELLVCAFCDKKSIHIIPCTFCGKFVCDHEAHYMPSKEETLQGVISTVIRVCPDCAPEF